MFNRRNLIVMMVMIISLVMFVPIAQAERQEYEGIGCYSNTHTPVQFSPTGEIYAGSYEGKGIFRSTSKPYFESTFHLTGVMKVVGGKASLNGFQKVMRADGDFTIWEFSGDSVSGATMKLIYGTGRFKGATGEQKVTMITKAKPIVVGTEQVCSQVVGWMELAK